MTPANVEDVFPLTPVQQGLLFHHLYAPEQSFYLDQVVLPLEGELDLPAFVGAWRTVVARHATLRTSFHWQGLAQPLQVVHHRALLPVSLVDLSGLARAALEPALDALLAADRRHGVDLGRPPLSRLTVVRGGPAEHRAVWSYHHLLLDAWSGSILFREVFTLYLGGMSGTAPALGPALPFRHYARWQKGEDGAAAEAFWRRELAGVSEPTPLPADGSEGAEPGGLWAEVEAALSPRETALVARFASSRRLTLNTLVQGAWALALAESSGVREVVFGATVSGRPPGLAGVESIVGMLVNTLPVRVALPPGVEVAAWLAELQARQAELSRFESSSLASIQGWSEVGAGRPLFESILAFENVPGTELAGADRGSGLRLEIRQPRYLFRTHYPLTAQVLPGQSLRFRLAFDRGRLSTTAARRFLNRVLRALAALVETPGRRLGDLAPFTAAERHALTVEWSGGEAPYPRAATLDRLFVAQAAARPEAAALVAGSEVLSYGELDRRAGRLAARLAARGVGLDMRVGVAVERSLELVVTLLAVLQAGGAYVPFDPEWPAERLALLVEESGVLLVVHRARDARLLAPLAVPGLDIDEPGGEGERPRPRALPESLCYLLFTSGSTGRPKGVGTPHRGVVRLVLANPYVHFGAGETLFHAAPAAFDASTIELWGALAHGARLVVARPGPLALAELAGLLERHAVTTFWVTTGLFHQLAEELPEIFGRLAQVLTGGELAQPQLFDRMLRASPPDLLLFHAYGPTECTVFATGERIRGGRGLAVGCPVPIGRPIANTLLRVLTPAGAPAPAGAPGELFLGGDGLARGYLGRPGLTAAHFVPDGQGREPGARLYRTGDRVRFLADGRLDFLGRFDDQVKIRGFRIEPGEVRAALATHPEVESCLVAVREDRPGERRLVAYVVPGAEGPPPEEFRASLRAHLAARLPAHMLPAAFVTLAALPLNANGKVDRRALPAPAEVVPAGDLPRRPPANELEAELARLWAHLLGVAAVGPEDDFFELGGHSLHATRLVSQLRQTFGVEVPLRTVFEQPTVAGLAAAMRAQQSPAPGSAGPAADTAAEDRSPLSFAQERLWFLDRLEPGLTAYNVPFLLALEGRLELAHLARALSAIVARHAVLRSRLFEVDGVGYQRAEAPRPLALPVVDLARLGGGAEVEARALAARELALPFDLARPPLLRARLLRLRPARSALLLTLHHIACDGWSMGVLLAETTELYAAFAAGLPSPLAPLPLQYADFAAWQRSFLTGEELARQLGFWQRELAALPPALELPLDRPRPAVQTYRGGRCPVLLPAPLARALGELATAQRVTLFMVLLTGFALTLERSTGCRDLAVGTAVANRNRAETEGLIGFFVNTLVLRLDLGGEPLLRELMARVRETTLAAYAHQDLPFERLVAEMAGARNLALTPLFQVFFVLQNTPLGGRFLSGLTMAPLEVDSGLTKFDLQLTLVEQGGEITGALEYNADLFDATTAARLASQLERLLVGMTTQREARIEELSCLSAAERWQLTGEWNDAPLATASGELLHSAFLTQVAAVPEAVALVVGEERLSYQDLARRAMLLAEHLASLGVGPEVRVGIALERTAELAVSLLGTLLAGGAYVPLDPAYPAARRAFMLADSGASVLLGGGAPEVLGERQPAAGAARPENLAYVIYTSGSTGTPKGVAIPHAAAAAFCRWARTAFTAAELGGTLAATSISFDLSVFELFAPFSAGGRAVLVPSVLHLGALEAAAEVRLINTVPSALSELLLSGELPPLATTVNLAGEALQRSLVEALYRQPGIERVLNLYGPSEDTTYSTCAEIPREGAGAPPIGRVVAGSRAYILDRHLRPMPLGACGPLYLGGVGLARGYLGRPSLTALRFVPDPFGRGARLYRTGDLARFRASGELDFLGRADHQVKIRGFRIELGEIEAVLAAHPAVRQAAVVARGDGAGGAQLAAFVVGEGEPAAWRAHLRERLPAYLVPAHFVALPALPLTASGKVDRLALEAPAGEGPAAGEYVAPRNAREEAIARLWAETLGLARVGVRDNFFELGGHSLLLIRVQARLKKALGLEVSIVDLFAHPTVEALARAVSRAGPAVPSFEHAEARAAQKRAGLEGRRRAGRLAP